MTDTYAASGAKLEGETTEDAQAKEKGDDTVITPFLTTLPLWVSNNDNLSGEWRYAVEAAPKHGEPKINPVDPDNPENPTPSDGGNNNGGGGGGGGGRRGNIIDPEGTPTAVIDEGGTPLEGLTPTAEQIDDEGVPLANNPLTQLIEDVLVPLGLLPKTGDGSISYAPLLALMAASGLLIMGLIWRRVRKVQK